MDQYFIDFEINILYFDLMEIIELIKNSKQEHLMHYAERMQDELDEHTQ